MRKLRSDTSSIAKATWRILKQVINRDTKSGDIERICHNGELVDSKALISETFNQHFVSIGEKLAGKISAPVNDRSLYLSKNKASNTNFKSKKIQPSQVYRLSSGLKNGKASGIDKIPNRILKQSKDIITPALTEMFNIFIKFNIFPDDLKLARVSPSLKRGMLKS